MYNLELRSVDEIQKYILERLFSEGERIVSRGLKTLEICNLNLTLSNPRQRETFIPSRKWKKSLAIGELAWHLSGSNSLEFITYYAQQWKNFSSDGRSISGSCYGHKIFQRDYNKDSQWDNLIKLLQKDRHSRRAVLSLYDPSLELTEKSKDIPCITSIQFLIRNNRLDSIVTMRSNDIIWGLPYDIYLFTMLQELLSLELGIELGKYYHNVGSMHIYERHITLGKEMMNDANYVSFPMAKMDNQEKVSVFLQYERKIRVGEVDLDEISKLEISNYWKQLLLILVDYKNKKIKSQSIKEILLNI